MHTLAKLLLDFLQLLPHAFADRRAPHRENSFPVLPADVREAKKVKCLRFAFPSLFLVPFGKPPELDQARFVWMEFQPKLAQPFPKTLQKTVCVCLMLESQDRVSSPGESHPEALSELYVSLSTHTAPIKEPLYPSASEQTALESDGRCCRSSVSPAGDGAATFCIYAWPKRQDLDQVRAWWGKVLSGNNAHNIGANLG